MPAWPRSGEDKQLALHWDKTGGTLYTEVCLGRNHWETKPWSGKSTVRRLDGVLVNTADDAGPLGHAAFKEAAPGYEGRTAQVVEVKAGLSEGLIGQALIGEWLFRTQVAEPHGIKMEETMLLYKHRDNAMVWVAKQLGLVPRRLILPVTNGRMVDRATYSLRDVRLARLEKYRADHKGLWLTRIPLGGPGAGVREWRRPAQTHIPFVRVIGRQAKGLVVYDSSHEALLRDPKTRIELVVVTRKRMGRGSLGVAAAHALMFEAQYGRPFNACRLVCGVSDPAIEAATHDISSRWKLPGVTVHSVGAHGPDDDKVEMEEKAEQSTGESEG
jgi:hypothetical protein